MSSLLDNVQWIHSKRQLPKSAWNSFYSSKIRMHCGCLRRCLLMHCRDSIDAPMVYQDVQQDSLSEHLSSSFVWYHW